MRDLVEDAPSGEVLPITEAKPSPEARRRWRHGDLKPPRLYLPVWGFLSVGLVALSVFADDWGMTLGKRLPPAVVDFFGTITRWGQSDWLLIPTGLLLIFLLLRRHRLHSLKAKVVVAKGAAFIGLVFAAEAFTGIIALIGKNGLGRARPFVEPGGLWEFIGPTDLSRYASFPSGHATTMGTLAMLAVLLLPWRWRIPVVVFTALVAVSRVVIDVHHVSDITAGYLLGLWGGWWVAWIFARLELGFKPTEGALPVRRPLNHRRFGRIVLGLVPGLAWAPAKLGWSTERPRT